MMFSSRIENEIRRKLTELLNLKEIMAFGIDTRENEDF